MVLDQHDDDDLSTDTMEEDADGGDDDEVNITVGYQGGRSRQVTVECCRVKFNSSEEKSDQENSLKKLLLFFKEKNTIGDGGSTAL